MQFQSVLRLWAQSAAAGSIVAAAAEAADINVTDAKIAGGKLVITGTTAAPNTWVRLDGQAGSDFNVKSGADGEFAFGVIYHPGDCIVDVQKLVAPTKLGAATAALVADCGPAGVSPRGAWTSAADYVANDLVTYQGSTWRARRQNSHKRPAPGVDWEIFAAGATAAKEPRDGGGASTKDVPTGPAGGDLAGNYPDPKIKNGAVTAAKLADGAVTFDKLANGAVNGAKVLDGSLTAADLAANSVGSVEIAVNAVNATKIVDDSIDGGEIVDNSLGSTDLATNSVGASELADNSVAAANVVDGSLTTSDVAGADALEGITVNGGTVSPVRCQSFDVMAPGALTGDAVVISSRALLQNGLLIYGQRVPQNNHATAVVCNLSGTAQIILNDTPIRIVTFR